jgi:hypothetical protein
LDGDQMTDLPELDEQEQDLDVAIKRWISTAKTHDVVSLSYYRRLRIGYQRWRPTGLKEYAISLITDPVLRERLARDEKRKAHNLRVAEAALNSNPFNTIA